MDEFWPIAPITAKLREGFDSRACQSWMRLNLVSSTPTKNYLLLCLRQDIQGGRRGKSRRRIEILDLSRSLTMAFRQCHGAAERVAEITGPGFSVKARFGGGPMRSMNRSAAGTTHVRRNDRKRIIRRRLVSIIVNVCAFDSHCRRYRSRSDFAAVVRKR